MEPTPADAADPTPSSPVSRRTVLRGAGALGLLGALGATGLVGCGEDDPADDGAAPPEPEPVMVVMTDAKATQAAGEEGRIPLGIGDSGGALLTDTPAQLVITVEDESGAVVQEATEVSRQSEGLQRAYYPLEFTAPAAGFYRATAQLGRTTIDAAFEVSEVADVVIPRPGQPLPPTATPTTDDARGVDPICTDDPTCPLHTVDLATVLGTAPVAVLVSTPAFCTTAICGPVLELFVAASEAHPDVTFIHVEPYASGQEVLENGPSPDNLSPAVEAWKLPFEPCLFIVDASGVVTERLDVIFDADELDHALESLL